MFSLKRVLSRLATWLMYMGGIGIVAMMLNVVADVTMRTVLNVALPGTIELVSSWYMVAFAFLPLAHIQAA